MKATTPTAAQVATARLRAQRQAVKRAAKRASLQDTKGKGLVFADLTPAHLKEAQRFANAVSRKFMAEKQIRIDALQDAISEALVYVYTQPEKWDSEKYTFHSYFQMVVRRYSTNATTAGDYAKTQQFDHLNEDGETQESAYTTGEYADSEALENESGRKAAALLATLRAKLSAKQVQVLELKLQGVEDEVIAELLDMKDTAVRKLIFDMRANVTKLTGLVAEGKKVKEFGHSTYYVPTPAELAELA